MTFEHLKTARASAEPPAGIPPLVRALWEDSRGHWDAAHEIAQRSDTTAGARVHAYLHRKEGDLSNARYWYRRAGTEEFRGTLSEEWEMLGRLLLPEAGAPPVNQHAQG